MTDLAGALADTSMLNDFEGLPVRRSAIEIPGAAGGLREAMKIEPREFHKGEEVYVVLKTVAGKIRFDPITKAEPDGDQVRVHILDVEEASFIEADIVEPTLREQRERIRLAKEKAKGVMRLPTDEELLRAHEAGEHSDEYVEDCVECEKEQAEDPEGDA